jgi:hypothetical protein
LAKPSPPVADIRGCDDSKRKTLEGALAKAKQWNSFTRFIFADDKRAHAVIGSEMSPPDLTELRKQYANAELVFNQTPVVQCGGSDSDACKKGTRFENGALSVCDRDIGGANTVVDKTKTQDPQDYLAFLLLGCIYTGGGAGQFSIGAVYALGLGALAAYAAAAAAAATAGPPGLDKQDEAALSRLKDIFCKTKTGGLEMCGQVFMTADGRYRASDPETGSEDLCLAQPAKRDDEQLVAYYHSHPPGQGLDFSDPGHGREVGDIGDAEAAQIDYYLINENGEMKRYTHSTDGSGRGRTRELGKANITCP